MGDAESEKVGFRRERRAGMIAIAAAMPVAFNGIDTIGSRMLFALKCFCLAVLFCLVTGVEAVAYERLSSAAFDPLSGFERRQLWTR
jgi:hypothetical protein